MQIQTLLTISGLVVLLAGCGTANKVTVNGVVKDSGGSALSGAQVQIVTPAGDCYARNEQPEIYTTDAQGKWSIYFVTGHANKDGPERRQTCEYTVGKAGFTTSNGTFSFCISGACAGEQTISTEVTLSP